MIQPGRNRNPPLCRWVDAKAAKSYMQHDAMIGRTRHWLPKELTGLDKIYRKRGLSFAIGFHHWKCFTLPIGFVVDECSLDSHIVKINGHETYLFSNQMDLHQSRIAAFSNAAERKKDLITNCLQDPDEAFIIGDIRSLASRLNHVIVRDESSRKLMLPWCDLHSIPLHLEQQR